MALENKQFLTNLHKILIFYKKCSIYHNNIPPISLYLTL